MTSRAEQPETVGAANHMMRRALHELERVRALAAREATEIRGLREAVRKELADTEREVRARVNGFTPGDIGQTLRLDLKHKLGGDAPPSQASGSVPETLPAAEEEWRRLAPPTQRAVRELVIAKRIWDHKVLKRKRTRPVAPDDLWRATERLSEIHAALPALRERLVAEELDSKAHLNADLAAEISKREAALEHEFATAREILHELEEQAGMAAASWGDSRWIDASPAQETQRVIRVGEFDPRLPASAGIAPVPALLEFPFQAGIAIATDVARRSSAIDLARSVALRSIAAAPPGDVRFVFIDPVSLGQAVADFRHLAEFDPRLVDTKTWTSERDIEGRLEELADHLELVISTYLRGQFESIDAYNRQAGEVAEPYRILVVFDYPTGFTGRSARQLLSLVENGTRCGVHTILVYDPAAPPPEEVPTDRLIHSMQRIDLTQGRGVALPEPVGHVDLDFLPDACPPISFSSDGRSTSPLAGLLVAIGAGARSTESGAVTIDRVLRIVNKQVASGRAIHAPDLIPGAPELNATDANTWWTGTTAEGACAPIGRAGAQDVAAMHFSSTEIAGGSIVVGVPRSGKSTALHAAIVSLSMIYSPAELELYLIDSKHGVEFKIYERLPHARLVSINSERAFSVAVLQSLDGEIQRRAELMKRRTAGKANITEYRAAAGEVLPRIVLFMDEFHEVFEEDDALGHEAFQAFSNIVRQGPFAGVHVVVASQTLSSIPAMDRGTLSLLPMRVAFMCNDADADLVMGDHNREVKAISQQGEGIFNPARGEPSHNKPFRGTYIAPDERAVLLAGLEEKADRARFERRPKVFDGDTLAARLEDGQLGSSTRPVFALGEPFDLQASAGVVLRRGRGANILLMGATGEAESAGRAVDGAMHSCLSDAAAQGLTIHVVDFIGDAGDDAESLDLMSICKAVGASYCRASGLRDLLADVQQEIASRREESDFSRDAHLVVLNGLERALDLAPADEYGDPDEPAQQMARPLGAILRDGPEFGCHAIAVVDRLGQFDRRLGREMLKEFDWRVAGSGLGPADIAAISESFTEGDVRESQLLVVDAAHGKTRRIRGYPRHTEATIRRAAERRHV